MSILVVLLPARPRLRARRGRGAPDPGRRREYTYVLSADGLESKPRAMPPPALLPRADRWSPCSRDTDVSWHRITLPRRRRRGCAPRWRACSRKRCSTTRRVHLAVAPQARPASRPGSPRSTALARRTSSRRSRRPASSSTASCRWPGPTIRRSGHFPSPPPPIRRRRAAPRSTWAHADGVASVRLQGGLARALLPQPPPGARWSATPAVAGAAERWLGAPVTVLPAEQRLLQAARSLWNLRQFDLAARTRGARALRDWRRGDEPGLAPGAHRRGGAGVPQIVGLNLWAWHSAARSRRAATRCRRC